jgi:hypothetical protein
MVIQFVVARDCRWRFGDGVVILKGIIKIMRGPDLGDGVALGFAQFMRIILHLDDFSCPFTREEDRK